MIEIKRIPMRELNHMSFEGMRKLMSDIEKDTPEEVRHTLCFDYDWELAYRAESEDWFLVIEREDTAEEREAKAKAWAKRQQEMVAEHEAKERAAYESLKAKYGE